MTQHSFQPFSVVPIPKRASSFLCLDEHLKKFNVETNLSGIETYGLPSSANEVILADLQLQSDSNIVGRLGSGRSGYYAGHYLKGIGRTTLAANWNTPEDTLHATGHLSASGAAREYISSVLLECTSDTDTIVPCIGLLARSIAGPLRRANATAAPRVDDSVQAISVKPANFIRASNVLWSVFHDDLRQSTSKLLAHFAVGLTPPSNRSSLAPMQLAPNDYISLIRSAAARALENFITYFRRGVYWSSFHNNISLDSRFVDLEVPVITGEPAVGAIGRANRTELSPSPYLVGFEFFHYIRQLRSFLKMLELGLEHMARARRESEPLASEFLRELRACVLKLLSSNDDLVTNKEIACDSVCARLAEILGLSPRQRGELRRIATLQYDQTVNDAAAVDHGLTLERLPLRLAHCDTIAEPSYMRVTSLATDHSSTLGNKVNSLLSWADDATTAPDFLDRVRSVANELRQHFCLQLDVQQNNNLPAAARIVPT